MMIAQPVQQAVQQTIQQDVRTIEDVLKATRKLAISMRYGGLGDLSHRAQGALDALDRVARTISTRQLRLFQEGDSKYDVSRSL